MKQMIVILSVGRSGGGGAFLRFEMAVACGRGAFRRFETAITYAAEVRLEDSAVRKQLIVMLVMRQRCGSTVRNS